MPFNTVHFTDPTDLSSIIIPQYTSTVKHLVKAGVEISKGQAVYVTGSTGQSGTNMIVGKASNAAEMTSSKTMGLLETSLAINGIGYVITEGLLAGLDTSMAGNVGDPVWLGTDGNLIYGLANKPHAPQHLVFIGIVTRKQQNNGEIFVKVQNGFEMDELHDLVLTNIQNGHAIVWDSAISKWINKDLSETYATLDNLGNSLGDYVPIGDVGQPDGVASLDSTGNVPASQLNNVVVPTINSATPILTGTVYGKVSSLDTINNSTGLGYKAFGNATGGTRSIAIGYQALNSVTTGRSNIAIGNNSMLSAQSSEQNIAIGMNSLYSSSGSNNNIAIGVESLYSMTTGELNIGIGIASLYNLTTGLENVAIGQQSLMENGSQNTAVGFNAGRLTEGNQNTFLGARSGVAYNNLQSGNNNILIGYESAPSATTVSNEITIGNSNNNRFRIPGLGIDWTSSTLPSATTWNYIGSVSSTSGSNVSFNNLNGQYKELRLTFADVSINGGARPVVYFRFNNDTSSSNYSGYTNQDLGTQVYYGNVIGLIWGCISTMISFESSSGTLTVANASSSDSKGLSLVFKGVYSDWITSSRIVGYESLGGSYNGSAVSSVNISLASGSFSSGTWKLWGLK